MLHSEPHLTSTPTTSFSVSTESLSHLLICETSPSTVVPLLHGLERSPATQREKDILYAFHLGHASPEVRRLCVQALVQDLDRSTAQIPILSAAYSREVDSGLRSIFNSALGASALSSTLESVNSSLAFQPSARNADLMHLVRDGASQESLNRLLLLILLDSNPLSQITALNALDSFTPALSPDQREATTLSCAYFFSSGLHQSTVSLPGAIRVLERLRPDSLVLREVLGTFLEHPDRYVRARASCALVSLCPEKSSDCAAVLAAALMDAQVPKRAPFDPPDTQAPKIELGRIARLVISLVRDQAEEICDQFEQLEAEHALHADRILQAFSRSIGRLNREFERVDKHLNEWLTGIIASMTLSHLEVFGQADRETLFVSILFLLDQSRASPEIYKPVLDQLPEKRGFERATFRQLAKIAFKDSTEDMRIRCCKALTRTALSDPQYTLPVASLLSVITDSNASIHFRREIRALQLILDQKSAENAPPPAA